jgi:hypothetical protein
MTDHADLEQRLRAHAKDYVHAHATERLLLGAAAALASLTRERDQRFVDGLNAAASICDRYKAGDPDDPEAGRAVAGVAESIARTIRLVSAKFAEDAGLSSASSTRESAAPDTPPRQEQ